MFTSAFAAFILSVVKAIPAATQFIHWISDKIREEQAQSRLDKKNAAVDRVLAPYLAAELQHNSNQAGQCPTVGAATGLPTSGGNSTGVGK